MSIHAKKSLGQNFLVNPHILDKIVSVAGISKEDTVLEVGPGTGNLTKKLAERAGRVIAIEKDHKLVNYLKGEFSTKYAMAKSVEIIEGDVLKLETRNLKLGPGYKIVANIPYYITSNFLRKVFEDWPLPKLIVLTIQKEVAQRIMAKSPHMNLLALSVQYYSESEIIGYISKNNFRPVPKVDSAIIRLKPKALSLKPEGTELLFQLTRIGFSEKRKQLIPVLSKKLKINRDKIVEIFENINISLTARAENLSLDQWQKLSQTLFLESK